MFVQCHTVLVDFRILDPEYEDERFHVLFDRYASTCLNSAKHNLVNNINNIKGWFLVGARICMRKSYTKHANDVKSN